MKKLFTVSALSVLLAACTTQTAVINGKSENKKPSYTVSQPFFISGIGQKKTINAAEICGSKSQVSQVETVLSAKNIIVGALTFGIYTPHTANVYCK